MEKHQEIITAFYQNISHGIFELQIHRDQKVIDQINTIIKTIFETFFINKYKDKYISFLKNVIEGLKYNIALISKDNLEINLLRAVFYELEKYNKGLPKEEISYDFDILKQIDDINNSFRKTYSTLKNQNDTLVKKLNGLLDELKKTVKNLSSFQIDLVKNSKTRNYQVFISHNYLDKPLAKKLSSELERFGIITWLDEKDILPGQSIPDEITTALENCTHFILIYSEHSKDKPWVKTELNNILMRRNSSSERQPIIIPLLLDKLLPPRLISEIKGIDFNNYDEGIKQLYKAFDIEKDEIISLTEVFKLIRNADKLSEAVGWCFHADFFLPIDSDYFWNFVECEDFINNFHLKPNNFGKEHFIFNAISYHNEYMQPHFDDEFFIFERSGKIGLYIVDKYIEILQRIIKLI